MPTKRKPLLRAKKTQITKAALDAYLARDEERLRKALSLSPADYTPMANAPSRYCVDPKRRWNLTPHNDLWPRAWERYDRLEALAKEHRKAQRAKAKA